MTIDEMIKICEDKAADIKLKVEPKVFEEIATELKLRKMFGEEYIDRERIFYKKVGYNDAIQDIENFNIAEMEDLAIQIREGKAEGKDTEFKGDELLFRFELLEYLKELKKPM